MTPKDKRKEFLEYIKNNFNTFLIYYPASGYDGLPKEIFGLHNVIHLSLDKDEQEFHYLEKLGEGIKILGDMRKSPIADDSIDVIYLRFSGFAEFIQESLQDFKRILKNKGAIVIEGLNFYERDEWGKLLGIFKDYELVALPKDFSQNQRYFGVRKNGQDDGKYVDSEAEMIDLVSRNKGWTGFEEILDYAVFRKI